MSRKRYSAEQIISKLREAEVLIAKGQSISRAAKALGVSEQTYYRWRKEYGGMRTDQARRLKALAQGQGARQARVQDHVEDGQDDAGGPRSRSGSLAGGGAVEEGPQGARENVLPQVPRRVGPRSRLPRPAAHVHQPTREERRKRVGGSGTCPSLDAHAHTGTVLTRSTRGPEAGAGCSAVDRRAEAGARGRQGDRDVRRRTPDAPRAAAGAQRICSAQTPPEANTCHHSPR